MKPNIAAPHPGQCPRCGYRLQRAPLFSRYTTGSQLPRVILAGICWMLSAGIVIGIDWLL